jgi:outer membrane protein TolC
LLVAALAARVHAEDVTLAQVTTAVDHAPAARATELDVAAAFARSDAAGAWPTTSIRLGTNRLTAREVAGIVVPLPILGTIGAARDEAAAQATVARDDATIARRELRLRAADAWLELARADTAVITLTAAATQAQELERIAQGRLDAGAGGQVDVTSAHAARARAEVAVATAKRETSARSAELAGLLGWDPATDRHSTGPLPGGAGDLERLRQGLARHPEHAAALAQIAVREASADRISVARRPGLAFEITGSFNDPTLTDQGGNLIGPDVFAGLNLELPLFGHLGDQLRAANNDTAAARERLTAVDAELAAGLVAAYRRWQAATEHVSSLERDVVPAQQQATHLAQQAYREGARELVTALQATRDLQDVTAELANARIDSALAWQQLAIAAGIDGDAR